MADADLVGKDDVEKHAADSSGSDNGNGAAVYNEKRGSMQEMYDADAQRRRGSIRAEHDSFFSAFHPSSFKRNTNARVVTEATDSEGRPLKDQPPAEPALAMKLKGRHLQMIAIGGSIGMPHAFHNWSVSLTIVQELVFSLVLVRRWQQVDQLLLFWLTG